MQPIETIYKGYRFRSRLEARWAVFFDAMKIEWEYEKEGFVLDDGSFYLPDFYLPKERKKGVWIEIKPGQFTDLDGKKFQEFARHFPIIAAVGIPEPKPYYNGLMWSDSVDDDFSTLGSGVAQWMFNSEHGISLSAPSGFQWFGHRFGTRRAIEYALKVDGSKNLDLMWSTCDKKWNIALTHACSVAKQARFEYGKSG